MSDDRRPLTDREMDIALSESGYPPVRYRNVVPMRFEPPDYERHTAERTPMCDIPDDADRPDRGMQALVAVLLVAAIAAVVVRATL